MPGMPSACNRAQNSAKAIAGPRQVVTSFDRRCWVMGLLVFVLAYNCATLSRVPAFLSDDDGAYASAAYQFWLTGRPGVPGYRDVVGLGSDVWPFGRTAAAVQGVFLHFAGVSIYAALLPSFLAGVALLVVTAAL